MVDSIFWSQKLKYFAGGGGGGRRRCREDVNPLAGLKIPISCLGHN